MQMPGEASTVSQEDQRRTLRSVSAREERLAKGPQGEWENHICSNILKYVSHYSFAPERKNKSHG